MNIRPVESMKIGDIDVHEIVVEAVVAASSGLQHGSPAVLQPDTSIYGSDGFMDSVGLVSLLVEIERQLEEKYGIALPIMDDKAFSKRHSPFRSLSTLESYVSERIKDVCGAGADCSS